MDKYRLIGGAAPGCLSGFSPGDWGDRGSSLIWISPDVQSISRLGMRAIALRRYLSLIGTAGYHLTPRGITTHCGGGEFVEVWIFDTWQRGLVPRRDRPLFPSDAKIHLCQVQGPLSARSGRSQSKSEWLSRVESRRSGEGCAWQGTVGSPHASQARVARGGVGIRGTTVRVRRGPPGIGPGLEP
jgi:hypothetical protein